MHCGLSVIIRQRQSSLYFKCVKMFQITGGGYKNIVYTNHAVHGAICRSYKYPEGILTNIKCSFLYLGYFLTLALSLTLSRSLQNTLKTTHWTEFKLSLFGWLNWLALFQNINKLFLILPILIFLMYKLLI